MDSIISIPHLRLPWKFIDYGLEIITSTRHVFRACRSVEWESLDVVTNALNKSDVPTRDGELCLMGILPGMTPDHGQISCFKTARKVSAKGISNLDHRPLAWLRLQSGNTGLKSTQGAYPKRSYLHTDLIKCLQYINFLKRKIRLYMHNAI